MFWPFGMSLSSMLAKYFLNVPWVLLAWGLTMAAFATNLPLRNYAIDLLKWVVGAFIVRSSACTVNDIFDRNMDACVGQLIVLSKGQLYSDA